MKYYKFIYYQFTKILSWNQPFNPSIASAAMIYVSGILLLNIISSYLVFIKIADIKLIDKRTHLPVIISIFIILLFINYLILMKDKRYDKIRFEFQQFEDGKSDLNFNTIIGNLLIFIFCTYFLFGVLVLVTLRNGDGG
ncbi:MAG: hypothetical protein EAZ53_03260 [Bacteroidetes bacterium]|nr:MAG: hypothetical protein EAZ53_03260 [Bacteroidota bacterium]